MRGWGGPGVGSALALALAVPALVWGGCRHPPGGAAELLAALGPRRPVEPRLADQTAYAPCRPAAAVPGRVPDALCSALPREGTADWNALAKAARRLGDHRHPTARDLEAQGIEKLLHRRQAGKADEAVETLRRASAVAPKDARIWSDLAAACYVRAQQDDEPQDLLFGLSAAGTAVDLAPALPEALFNRALLLDRLYLRGEAEAAWRRYLEVDSRSPWAQEARAHLRELAAPSTPELWKRQLPALRQAALAGEDGRVREIVAVSPQAAREFAVEEVLGGWGRDVLAGRGKEAAEELRVAEGIGKALLGRGGDGTVAESVAVLNRAAGRPDLLLRLARGHRAYALGGAAFGTLQVENAEAPFQEARDTLGPAASPVGLWAEVGLAGIVFYRSRFEEAAAGFSSVAKRADPRLPALAGRAEWGLGVTRLRQGQLTEALVHYRTAAGLFSRTGEAENLGAIHDMQGETFYFLGDHDKSWSHRYQALHLLRAFPSSLRLHNLLWQIGDAAREEVDSGVALVVQNEGVRVAEAAESPRMKAEALLWRSKIRSAMGGFDFALSDLRQADLALGRIPDGVAREKLQMDVAFARAEVERHRDPLRAVALFQEPLAYYRGRSQALDLAAAYLSRARAAIAASQDAVAEADLDAAIALFEHHRIEMQDIGLRLSYSETVQGLFDEKILLESKHKRAGRAFEFSERARAVPLEMINLARARETPISAAHLNRRLSRLPKDVVFIEYAWLRDRLLRWTVRRNEVILDSVSSQGLSERLQAFSAAMRARAPERLAEAAKVLYADLIPEAARALPTSDELFFIPDKTLNQVPFAALQDPASGHYLIEEYAAVGVVPSLSFYLAAMERQESGSGSWNALLVANPAFDRKVFAGLEDLREAETEVAELRVNYPQARVLAGTSATKRNFLAHLDEQEVLEYAGHAIDNPNHPEYSHLILAPEGAEPGALFVHELASRPLKRLRLVVLSACHTITARDLRVGGLSGIARPFLDMGAQAVLGTLWDLNDRAGALFMREFHRRFRTARDASAALRETQLAYLHDPNSTLRSPDMWGAFQLVGSLSLTESEALPLSQDLSRLSFYLPQQLGRSLLSERRSHGI